jgi:uncharacterized protein
MLTETASPCINICQLDAAQRYCIGCLRTIDEIANWSGYTAEQRAAVLRKLAARTDSTLKNY